ncbi:MAG: Nif3-like dinuclear metal center hexameric protein [Oscillospiraceae bacterium]|nr:Nif3-like dinuclear metal center hexameric protein [Oscillospiraceae bacterium]
MIKVKDLLSYLDELAPMTMKLDFDNVGLLVGRTEREVTRVLVALDITEAVIAEAIDLGAGAIVAHHPLFFTPLSRVTDENASGRRVLELARHDIAAICMHTNLDAVEGGINDELARAVGLQDTSILWEVGEMEGVPYGLGRIGTLPVPATMAEFLAQVKMALGSEGLRYHDAGRPVQQVAVMGGSGGDELGRAIDAGCDTYVVGEVKYHHFLQARDQGVNLIEADHYCTEDVISAPLCAKLAARFPGVAVTVSERHDQVARFF